jgi:hypothetical protein
VAIGTLGGVSRMPKVVYFADAPNGNPGGGATIRLDSGEPCLISIAQSGVLVRKPGLGPLGAVLYKEENIYKATKTADALSKMFPVLILPDGVTDPVLSGFLNAVMHCHDCSQVTMILNEATNIAAGTNDKNVMVAGNEEGTQERPIRISATSSTEAIRKEYAILGKMFGTTTGDWKFVKQSLLLGTGGLKLDKLTINVSGRRKEIFFDITSALSGDAS